MSQCLVARLLFVSFLTFDKTICLYTEQLTVTVGEMFHVNCTLLPYNYWQATFDNQTRDVAVCQTYRNQSVCTDIYHPYYTAYIKSFIAYNVTYLQVSNTFPNMFQIKYGTCLWNISVTDQIVTSSVSFLILLANNVRNSLEVHHGANITFTCMVDSDNKTSLFMYMENNVLDSSLHTDMLNYTLYDIKTGSFHVHCNSKWLSTKVFVTVLPCEIYFTANSFNTTIDVATDSHVDFICKTEYNCPAHMVLSIGSTGETLLSIYGTQSIHHVISDFECGTSFHVECQILQGIIPSLKSILVQATLCVVPTLQLSVNNMDNEEIVVCAGSQVTISCSYQGQSRTKLSVYLRGLWNNTLVLKTSRDKSIDFTLTGDYIKNNYYWMFDNWLGCTLQNVTKSKVEVKLKLKECIQPSINPNIEQVNLSPTIQAVVGITLGMTIIILIHVVIIVVYCKHKRRASRPSTATHIQTSTDVDNVSHIQTSTDVDNVSHIQTSTDVDNVSHIQTSTDVDNGRLPDPPTYEELFVFNTSIAPYPPPEYHTLPPSYEEVLKQISNV